ncbi:hypothetical protein Taro_024769 [Colocasia esculenta]|uniref:Uncharacterized protein n=1 Tax=Colocasia esculenta TaxID=4460 RepID=A0A843VIF6_COLES|nr:hypothetical protein [Colocasia esculenta]
MAADYWLAATILDVGVHISGRLHEGLPGLHNCPEIPAHLHHSLGHATHVAVPNGNDPQKTTELFSFGRPEEEKLKSHHHPQLNSVNQRVNVVNRRPLHRQRESGGVRERLRDPVTGRKRTVYSTITQPVNEQPQQSSVVTAQQQRPQAQYQLM